MPLTLSEADASAKTPPCLIPSTTEVQLQQPLVLISHEPACHHAVSMSLQGPCARISYFEGVNNFINFMSVYSATPGTSLELLFYLLHGKGALSGAWIHGC